MAKTDGLATLNQAIDDFTQKRDWHSCHTPKNLAMALSVECAELVEIFQWLTPAQSRDPDAAAVRRIGEEIGDIMIYLAMIAAAFGIDPIAAGLAKVKENDRKHPAAGATEFPSGNGPSVQ